MLRMKSRKKYKHDMIQRFVNQTDKEAVKADFDLSYRKKELNCGRGR